MPELFGFNRTWWDVAGGKISENTRRARTFGTSSDLVKHLIGGDEEDRTPDLRIANATLSQLSYVPISSAYFITNRNAVV
jgi:hypothetical protein